MAKDKYSRVTVNESSSVKSSNKNSKQVYKQKGTNTYADGSKVTSKTKQVSKGNKSRVKQVQKSYDSSGKLVWKQVDKSGKSKLKYKK